LFELYAKDQCIQLRKRWSLYEPRVLKAGSYRTWTNTILCEFIKLFLLIVHRIRSRVFTNLKLKKAFQYITKVEWIAIVKKHGHFLNLL